MSQQIVKALGSTVLARLAASQGSQAKVTLIAVPSSRERLLQRGFNPAQVLALGLQRHLVNYPSLAITVMPDLIFKTKHTSRQGLLNRQQRLANLTDAYAINPKVARLKSSNDLSFQDHHFLVIDDVITTGATMQQLCTVLSTLRPASITRAAFARTDLAHF